MTFERASLRRYTGSTRTTLVVDAVDIYRHDDLRRGRCLVSPFAAFAQTEFSHPPSVTSSSLRFSIVVARSLIRFTRSAHSRVRSSTILFNFTAHTLALDYVQALDYSTARLTRTRTDTPTCTLIQPIIGRVYLTN